MKFVTQLALIACIILVCATFSLAFPQTLRNTSLPLHVSGNQILNSIDQVVILRGIGRTGDLQSASGMWSSQGMAVADWSQKWLPISSNMPLMDATFQCYQKFWQVNMIRMLIPVNWYWQNNIVPFMQDPTYYPNLTTPISYQAYIATVAQQAAKYGLYVDICPYELVSNYQDNASGGAQGQPMGGWDSAGQSFLANTGLTELQFWSQYWTLMAKNLKSYPNIIFEAWNEPENSGNDAVTSGYMNYLTTMYTAVRDAGAKNLIFMQWDAGYVPTYNNLSWASQISAAIPNALNLAFTTHAYRHGPNYNFEWGTNTTPVEQQLQSAIQSMGVNAPLVINEAGSCLFSVPSNELQLELDWWNGLNQAASTLHVGVTAYYWISDSDIGPAYTGETLLSGAWQNGAASPTPNSMGQIFLKYVPSASLQPSQQAFAQVF